MVSRPKVDQLLGKKPCPGTRRPLSGRSFLEKNDKKKESGPSGGCSDFRLGLVLGSLHRRLEESDDPAELDRLRAEIDEIEKSLGLS